MCQPPSLTHGRGKRSKLETSAEATWKVWGKTSEDNCSSSVPEGAVGPCGPQQHLPFHPPPVLFWLQISPLCMTCADDCPAKVSAI